MGACCSNPGPQTQSQTRGDSQNKKPLSAEEKEEMRKLQAEAALKRKNNFSQGGGGEKLKAKSKALEDAEKRNKELGPDLDWNS